MKTKLITFFTLITFAAGNLSGFKGGQFWGKREFQQQAVTADAGHYDPRSAEFKFGSAASASLVTVATSEIMDGALTPARKPVR